MVQSAVMSQARAQKARAPQRVWLMEHSSLIAKNQEAAIHSRMFKTAHPGSPQRSGCSAKPQPPSGGRKTRAQRKIQQDPKKVPRRSTAGRLKLSNGRLRDEIYV